MGIAYSGQPARRGQMASSVTISWPFDPMLFGQKLQASFYRLGKTAIFSMGNFIPSLHLFGVQPNSPLGVFVIASHHRLRAYGCQWIASGMLLHTGKPFNKNSKNEKCGLPAGTRKVTLS